MPKTGIEPVRDQISRDFKSRASTYSATWARMELYYNPEPTIVQDKFFSPNHRGINGFPFINQKQFIKVYPLTPLKITLSFL